MAAEQDNVRKMTMQLNSVNDNESKKEKQISDLKDELRSMLAKNQTL